MIMPRIVRLALLILSLAGPALAAGVLHLASGDLGAGDLARLEAPASDDGIWVAHFTDRIGAQERASLEDAGFEILGYLPEGALIVRGRETGRLAALPGVDFAHPLRPEWRREPSLAGRGGEVLPLVMDLWPGQDARRAAGHAAALGAQNLEAWDRPGFARVALRAPAESVEALSAIPGLRWLAEPVELADRLDEMTWVVQSADPVTRAPPVWEAGLHGAGQILGHLDSGFLLENCFFYDPDGNPVGPQHRKVVYMEEGLPYSSHGLHTASILAGDIFPVYGWDTNRGMAWAARLATSRYDFNTLYADLLTHHDHGARLHSNSWGSTWDRSYNLMCHDIDRFTWEDEEDLVVFAVMNGDLYDADPILSPENAKNVLAVGATHNSTAFDLFGSACTGPTLDGRRKPEIYAPGMGIWAAARATTDNPEDWQNFCKGVGKSGTSMACPSVTGCAALIRQYFTEGWYPDGVAAPENALTPSGALMRAMLLNATADLDGLPGPPPGDFEGWGRMQMNLGLKLAPDSPLDLYLEDVRHAAGLDTGQERLYPFVVDDDSLALKATLAFSDYPGEVSSQFPVVNDIDLKLVAPSGAVYWGNAFAEGESQTGGEPDSLNSVERVVLNAPEAGIWVLHVIGREVPMGPQGYAFAVSGQLSEADLIFPILALDYTLTEEGALRVLLASDEALVAGSVSIILHGDAGPVELDPEALDETGRFWTGDYDPALGEGLFQVQACGSDAAANQSCVDGRLSLRRLAAGQSELLESPDGGLWLDLPPGALPEDATLLISERPLERSRLAAYRLRPDLVLSVPALLQWDFTAVDFPENLGPADLNILDEQGGELESYFDADGGQLLASLSRLGDLDVLLGESGGSEALDAGFLSLGQAWPNPFQPADQGELRFSLELRASRKLKAEIFDVSGRRVALLHEGWSLPGTRELVWNGRDDEGRDMASGVYFLRLDAEDQGLVRKLVMVR